MRHQGLSLAKRHHIQPQSRSMSPRQFSCHLISLQDEDCQVRYNAANALLYRPGKNSLLAQNVMIDFIEGTEENFRIQSAQVLRNLNTPIPEMIDLWLSLLKDRDLSMRSVASSALSQLAKISDKILPEVLQWLEQNRDEDVMGGAIDCLYAIVVE
jgi:HEAT repeat protein